MAEDLALAVAEARMSAAHFKLQHSLLAMESQESAQRAEVEHQMMRREVEVLQAGEHHHRGTLSSTSRMSQQPVQSQIDALVNTCNGLEEDKVELEHMLQTANHMIDREVGKAELLYEENLMLKKRIRENREHFTKMRQSPAFSAFSTPRNNLSTPQRKPVQQFQDAARSRATNSNQDPFAALLAADQVLNAEAASLPSTPTKSHTSRYRQGHNRGAFSLSSLQTGTAGERIYERDDYRDHWPVSSAPNTQRAEYPDGRARRDRDSTISASDDEVVTDDDLPQSQASSLATSMLRQFPGSQEALGVPGKVEKSSKALQTKLFGKVTKPGMQRKRHASFDGGNLARKNAKLNQAVGLGIGAWE
jgi:hypothetical protein